MSILSGEDHFPQGGHRHGTNPWYSPQQNPRSRLAGSQVPHPDLRLQLQAPRTPASFNHPPQSYSQETYLQRAMSVSAHGPRAEMYVHEAHYSASQGYVATGGQPQARGQIPPWGARPSMISPLMMMHGQQPEMSRSGVAGMPLPTVGRSHLESLSDFASAGSDFGGEKRHVTPQGSIPQHTYAGQSFYESPPTTVSAAATSTITTPALMVETAADSAYKGMPQLSPAMEGYSETITTSLSDAYVATDSYQPSKSSHITTPKVSAERQKELLEKTFKVIDTLATVEFIKLERDHDIPIAKSRREYKAWKLSGSKPGAKKRDARSSAESVAIKSSSKKQKVMDDQSIPYPLLTARSPEVNISGSIPVQQASQHVAGGVTTSASPQHSYSRSVSDPGAYQPRGTETNPLIVLAGAVTYGSTKDSDDAVKESQLPSTTQVSTSSASGLRLRIPPPSDSKKESPLPKKKGRWRLAQPMEEAHGTLSTASSGVTTPEHSAGSSHADILPPITTAFLTQHSSLASDASASLAGLLRRNRDANRRMVQQISSGEQSTQGGHGETTAYEDLSE